MVNKSESGVKSGRVAVTLTSVSTGEKQDI